jgi:RNA polymerase sigma-70 factor (ECF subfamily)
MSALPPFWSLVERHGAELLAHARRLSGDAAEDVFQEALLRALRSYPRLEHGDHLRAWLYRITTTTAFDHSVKRGKEIPVEEVPASTYETGDLDGDFEALIEALPNGSRTALRLRYVDDLEYEQIGARLGCSPEAARQRVSTGVRALRRRLS